MVLFLYERLYSGGVNFITGVNIKGVHLMAQALGHEFVDNGEGVIINMSSAGSFGREAIESLATTGAVGEICSVFYDINGREVQTPFTNRIIAVGLEKLRQLEYSIGLAASREKVPAIMGALRGKLINVLITDEETAKILLNE